MRKRAILAIGLILLVVIAAVVWRWSRSTAQSTIAAPPTVRQLAESFRAKQHHFESGEISYSTYTGHLEKTQAEAVIAELTELCEGQAVTAGKSAVLQLLDAWRKDGNAVLSIQGRLLFNRSGYLQIEGKPATSIDPRLREKFHIKDDMVLYKTSLVNGTQSILDPLTKQLSVSATSMPFGLSIALGSFDGTFVDPKNLESDVPGRSIQINPLGSGYTVTFSRKGYERHYYEVRSSLPYLRRIDARIGEHGLRIERFYLAYSPIDKEDGSASNVTFPTEIVELVQQENGGFSTKIISVDMVKNRLVADDELVIAINDDVAVSSR